MKVNGETAEPGCYIDGHWGQYGPDRLAEICEQFDLDVTDDIDPRRWRFLAESDDPDDIAYEVIPGLRTKPISQDDAWERHTESADTLENMLNDVTEGGHWSWEDGEFFLTQTEVERLLFVQAADYEDAWQQVVESHVNEHCGYTDQYQACELADDDPDGDRVFQFRITVHYQPEEAQ